MQTAIVAEGGGQRGIYTAGVLDAFLQAEFNPFNEGLGVSAGAQNLLAYFLGETGYARRAIADLTAAPDFFVPYRWFGTRGIVDLDGYFDRVLNDPDYELPCHRYGELVAQRRLRFVATDRESLDAVYLEPDATSVMTWLKASSAVPFLYRSGVPHDDRCLVDGGVADPVPVQRAYEHGARRILLIRTVGVGGELDSSWRHRLNRIRSAGAMPNAIARLIERHEEAMAETEAFIANPPDDLELIQLAPRAALCSQVFGSRSESLVADYHIGEADGLRVLAELEHWRFNPILPSAMRLRSANDTNHDVVDPLARGATV